MATSSIALAAPSTVAPARRRHDPPAWTSHLAAVLLAALVVTLWFALAHLVKPVDSEELLQTLERSVR